MAAVEDPGLPDPGSVHQILQAAFGWEAAHLHKFTPDDPLAPLRPVTGEIPDVLQWLPGQECEEPETDPRRIAPWISCSPWVLAQPFMNTTLATAGFTGSSWRPAGLQAKTLRQARPIDGARRGLLEDSAGFPGNEEIMDDLAGQAHPDHAEQTAWVAEISGSDRPFDPIFLDIPAVNLTLADRRFQPPEL